MLRFTEEIFYVLAIGEKICLCKFSRYTVWKA